MDFVAAQSDSATSRVDDEGADRRARSGAFGQFPGALDAPQQGLDPRDQFAHPERLGQIVVRADPEADDARLWEALALAGMDDEVRRMPGGLDAQVGEHGSRLSGGQAQRLAIARAALRDAPVLILDEPTSQVDLGAEAEILAALDRLAAGRTVVMIAHRPGAILAADRVRELGGVQA